MSRLHKGMPILVFLIIPLFFLSTIANGQYLESRFYANLPKNMNAIGFSYIFLKGNVVTEPHCPLLILPSRAIILVLAMCAHLDWQINGRDIIATRTGFADMRIRFGINLFESPALKKKIFVLTSKKLLLERV